MQVNTLPALHQQHAGQGGHHQGRQRRSHLHPHYQGQQRHGEQRLAETEGGLGQAGKKHNGKNQDDRLRLHRLIIANMI